MQLSFHGAAHTVTGSKHLIELENGKKILLDCGMFQGMGKETLTCNSTFGFNPTEISYVILSHAHIDHSGLLPNLYAEGFRGAIYCTPATVDLGEALLADSARIQDADVRHVNKKKEKQGKPIIKPLYTIDDAVNVSKLFSMVDYDEAFVIDEDVTLLFTDAGHILGSASVNLTVTENGTPTHLTFSGDVGRYTDAILRMPAPFPQADYIIIESTYGNSLHEEFNGTEETLLEQINHTCVDKKGSLVIPAFSVGRTQELLFALNSLSISGRLPKVKYYVDSPLSITATEIIKKYPKYYNDNAKDDLQYDRELFNFPGLQLISSREESMALNDNTEPMVIISASGMADAGRIKHHIANKINDQRNTIMLVGYCSPNGLGGRLIAGDKEVKIFTEWYNVNAEVATMRSMSAHGDYEDLLHYLECQDAYKVKEVFVVHGDYEVQKSFREKLINKGFKNVRIPEMHQKFSIS